MFFFCKLTYFLHPGACSTVMEQSKGFGGPEVLDAELGGDIVSEDGTPVAAVGADSKSKPKVRRWIERAPRCGDLVRDK